MPYRRSAGSVKPQAAPIRVSAPSADNRPSQPPTSAAPTVRGDHEAGQRPGQGLMPSLKPSVARQTHEPGPPELAGRSQVAGLWLREPVALSREQLCHW